VEIIFLTQIGVFTGVFLAKHLASTKNLIKITNTDKQNFKT